MPRSEPQASGVHDSDGKRPPAARSEPQASGVHDSWRSFLAIELSDAARAAAAAVLAELRRRAHGDAVRWVRPETLHVTLRFLGDIEPAQVAELAAGVGMEVGGLAPFELRLGAAHLFPSPRRPRVVALDVAPRERLAALAAAVERGVTRAGLPAEKRPFRGHLTLGRLRDERAPAVDGAAADVAGPVEEVVLFRSELARSGAIHTPLERLPLKGASADVHP